jgi:undecaprenyl-diphosphatase
MTLSRTFRVALLLAGLAASVSDGAYAGLDHKVPYDDSGIWNRNVQLALINTLVAVEIGGALWEGSASRFGRACWQAIDASGLGALTSEAMKHIFTRSRPSQTDSPNEWFQGAGHYSFPSGEVTAVTAISATFMLEYGKEYPLTYALALLPAYDAVARVKVQGHWQTDVLAGLALGAGFAYFAHTREVPLFLSVLPHGFAVGIRTSF